jgi:pyruvate/2-oxoglutarate dehydrogenase complex dihydrolipoamide dehydrogenase (E3) component
VRFFTHERIFDNDRLPERLLVLGAGPVGMELAQAYARLGARVAVVDEDLLPREEPEVRKVMAKVFAREGIECVFGLATAVSQDDGQISLQVGSSEEKLRGDMLLVAAGRRPNVDGLNLGKAGVSHDQHGIHVDENLRTSARHIYAAGDCLGGPKFTHLAAWQGYKAARNALLPGSSSGTGDVVPMTTFTDPEIARVGLGELAAREKFGDRVRTTRWDMARVDRAVIDGARDGFIKIVHQTDGTLLGATIVAANAGELITEFVLGLRHRLKVGDLAGAMHAYPTYSSGVQMLAAEIATEDFLASVTGKLVCRMSGFAT